MSYGIIDGMPGVDLLYNYEITRYVPIYIAIISLFLLSFILGSILPLKFRKTNTCKIKKYTKITAFDIFLLSLPFTVFGEYTIFNARSTLFKGYSIDYNAELMGTLATCNCIFLILYLYLRQLPFSRYRNWFLFLIIEFSVILIGLGSRMYVLIPILAIGMEYISTHKIPQKRIFVSATIIILLFLAVGIIRLSSTDFRAEMLVYIGCAEPLLTWISAISYINYNDISLFSTPFNFISSFLNFIPTILWSDKSQLIIPIIGEFDAPLGATSLLTSLLDNFGLIGSCICLYILGAILTIIRYNWRSKLGISYYYCVCSIIPFQLFRDNFSIVNKMLFFNFLIIPGILFGVIYLLKRANEIHKQNASKYKHIP